MQPDTARQHHPRRNPFKRISLFLLLAVASILFFVARPRAKPAPPASAGAALAEPKPSGYQNRALLRLPVAAAPAEAPRPTISGNVYSTDGDPLLRFCWTNFSTLADGSMNSAYSSLK